MDKHQRDVLWLGDEEAHLGPAARAALGILLEKNDWTWWDDPSKTLVALERAVPRLGPAKWGGDSSAMDADQWVDPLRAIMLARAFNALDRQGPPKIKVARSVWSWPDGADAVGAVILELSQLVGPGYAFPEWERNAKPRFPAVHRSQEERCVVTSPNLSPDKLIGSAREYLECSPDSRIADIVVADSVEVLRTIKAARLVILYSQSIQAELVHVSSLRDKLSAQCVVHIQADESNIANWLQLAISSWAGYGKSFADAVEAAAALTGLRTLVLSSTQSFLLGRGTFFSLFTTVDRRVANPISVIIREYSRQTLLSEPVIGISRTDSTFPDQVDSHVPELTPPPEKAPSFVDGMISSRNAARPNLSWSPTPQELNTPRSVQRPAAPVQRVLSTRVLQGHKEVREWPKEGVVHIEVDIRIKTPLRDSRPPFPDDRIEWHGEGKVLQVHLFEFGREPESQTLELSRTRGSTTATFTRDSGPDPVDLRFLVSDGAQILQTARLQSAAGEPIQFFIENIVAPLHQTKEAFDVALLVNDSLGGRPSVTIITGDGEAVFSPLSEHDTAVARDKLLGVLQEAVANPNASLAPLMLKLANRGALLLRSLKSIEPAWPGNLGRAQLVTQSDAFFPIEYLYEGTVPDSADAVLCTQRAACLNKGQAISGCSIRDAGVELCPMGFLGISGVVERHTWKAGLDPRLWGAPGTNKPNRHRIENLSRVAFAASDKADNFEDADVAPHEVVRIANIETSLGVKKISNWSDWKIRLAQDSPSLLLLLVHLEDEAVYVGADSSLLLGAISEKHVGNAPVVIAIGCSSGLGDIPGGSLPAILQRSGARVVVAAMTNVLGRHANRVARDLAKHLEEASKAPSAVTVGEIISKLRRRLLIDGLALGLALVAFGDADIVLGKE